ncbi:sensor histidine kinase [Paenibacillus sp. N3.4]|nr:sensor histidine kinase [Paenibacillus sp. N3.4]
MKLSHFLPSFFTRKLFIKNLLLLLLPLLIPLAILGSMSILITQNYVKEDINNNNLKLIQQVIDNIELTFSDLDSLSLIFKEYPDVITRLKPILNNPTVSLDDLAALNLIKSYLGASANAKSYIHSIYVYYNNGADQYLSSNDGIVTFANSLDTEWYGHFLKADNQTNIWTEPRVIKKYEFEEKGTPVITMYKKLFPIDGVLVLNIRSDAIQKVLSNAAAMPGQYNIIFDEHNHPLLSDGLAALSDIRFEELLSSQHNFFTWKSGGKDYMVTKQVSKRLDWTVLSIVPQESIYKIPFQLSTLSLSLCAVSFILGLILTFFFTVRNYNHIFSIVSILDSAEKGNPLPSLPNRINDEYGYIIHNILKTFIEQSYLKFQLSERKYKQKTLELLALQSQINPHLLYNTLNAIYWEVMKFTGKPNQANYMIEHLTDILQYSLSDPEQNVILAKEVKYTESYIQIQKFRYQDKFDVRWEYDEEVLALPVTKLIFQPLIENCIYHGINEKEGKSGIKIKIARTGSLLNITVIDNGVGITPDKLLQIRDKLQKDGEYTDHIGLYNTNKRLKLNYGDTYGLNIRSKRSLGTIVYITIPI